MNSPIFIIGTPRSGTTLIANILGRHSNLFMPGENHFFEDIYANRNNIGDLYHSKNRNKLVNKLLTIYGRYNQGEDQQRIDELFKNEQLRNRLLSKSIDYASAFTEFMTIQMENKGKIRWGNNTPKDVFHIDEIISFYPDVKIIVMVRDARDFILSYKDRWKVTSQEHKDRLKYLYHPVITSLLWKSSVRRISHIKCTVPNKNLIIVRYESLVNDPKNTVSHICDVIEEVFEENMLDIITHNSSENVSSGGIFTTSVDHWKEKLSKEESYVVQLLTRRELQEFGYRLEKISVNPFKIINFWLSTPYALYRAMAANRHNRGPIIPYLIKRIAGLFSAKN